jgi:hypothetical protein
MGAHDQSDIFQRQPCFHKFFPYVIKQFTVAGVDEYTGWSVNQIGIAVVGGSRFPYKGVDVIDDFHGGFYI